MAQGTPKTDMSDPSDFLHDIHDRMVRLKNLLVVTEEFASNYIDFKGGPLFAIIEVSLIEARHLDRLVDDLWESPSLALKV